MNIIVNKQDLDKGRGKNGRFNKNQLALFGLARCKITRDNPPIIGLRCRAETMQRFIEIRSGNY